VHCYTTRVYMLRESYYHRTVRTAAVITALVLAFDSGVIIDDTRILSDSATQYLANAVGVMAVVPENEINKLSAEIAQRSAELDAREREIDAQASGGFDDRSTYLLSSILLLLLVLIVANYILDFVRARKPQTVVV